MRSMGRFGFAGVPGARKRLRRQAGQELGLSNMLVDSMRGLAGFGPRISADRTYSPAGAFLCTTAAPITPPIVEKTMLITSEKATSAMTPRPAIALKRLNAS